MPLPARHVIHVSVHVHGQDVDDRSEHQDVEEWKMKEMPEREHPLVEAEGRNAPDAPKVLRDEARENAFELRTARGDTGVLAGLPA